jgi:hypothetical protein
MKKTIGLLLFSCLMLAVTATLQAHSKSDIPASAGAYAVQQDFAYETAGNISMQDVCVNISGVEPAVILQAAGQLCTRQNISVPECTVILLKNSRQYAYSYGYCQPVLRELRSNSIKV